MILTAGLTPAWQQILVFERFEIGEVNRAREAHWCASGKVLNVGRALFHLGADSQTLALVGGPSGSAIQREFAQWRVPARWVESSRPTRVCTTIIDSRRENMTELVENAAIDREEEWKRFLAAYAEESRSADWIVLSGSLPDGVPSTLYAEMLAITPGQAILDIRGPELLEALSHKPFLIKPNREELAKTLNRPLNDDRELKEALRELNRSGAEWMVVTQGAGPVWISGADECFSVTPPPLPVVNPIGCGDCLAAGIAWGLDAGLNVREAIRMGMAASADNLGQLLPARLDPEQVRRIAESIPFPISR